MKNFTHINAGNVTVVKSAISIGKAIILINSGIIKNHAVSDDIIEKNDIYSLYDHDNLFIYRKDDTFFVARLSKFYMKDQDNMIVVASFESRYNLERKLAEAGYSDSDPIWVKMTSIYDKCMELQEELDNKRFEKEKDENENKPDPEDIFDLFSDIHTGNSAKFENDLFKELAMKINNCDGECENCDRHHDDDNDDDDNEIRKEIYEEVDKYIKENGHKPSPDRLLDIMMKKKFKGKIDPEKFEFYNKFAKAILSNPIAGLAFSAFMREFDKK